MNFKTGNFFKTMIRRNCKRVNNMPIFSNHLTYFYRIPFFGFCRNHQVQLDTEGDQVFTVQGVDEYGYLEIKSKDGGKTISVQPDGNSYDMMRNLIHMKTH